MGKIMQKAVLENAYDLGAEKEGFIGKEKIRKLEVNFIVDTGAAMICLPPSFIQSLGLRPDHKRMVNTANGKVERTVYSPVKVHIFDRTSNIDVMDVPEGTPPLLGYLALESLDLYPNPVKQILEGNPELGGKMVMDMFTIE